MTSKFYSNLLSGSKIKAIVNKLNESSSSGNNVRRVSSYLIFLSQQNRAHCPVKLLGNWARTMHIPFVINID